MGIMDKAKFWKKGDDELGDLSDLGDFGLDDHSGANAQPNDLTGPLPSLDDPQTPGMQQGVPTHMEEIHPTDTSQDMSDQLGLKPASTAAPLYSPSPAAPQASPPPAHAAPQAYGGPDMKDLAKEIEIVHAKLDSIKSTLDSINQRLATLERIATPETKNRYAW